MVVIIASIISTLVGVLASEVCNLDMTISFLVSLVAYFAAHYYMKQHLNLD